MQSSFAGIELGKRSLITNTQNLNIVGHNMSSASLPGYSRQRVEMRTMPPLYVPGLAREETPGQIGQGVSVERIERIRDVLLDGRIIAESSLEGYWSQRDKYILMLEQVYNEPLELSVRALMDKFWQAWQELSVNPAEIPARLAVLRRGKTLIDAIHNTYERLSGIRRILDDDLNATVERINSIVTEIASLNEQIVKIQAMEDSPNDLLDRRDLLVEELSSLIDISIGRQDPDEFIIYSGGKHLVQGRSFRLLETESDVNLEGMSRIFWKDTGEIAGFQSGKLGALIELRDSDAKWEIQKLDMMTINFIDMVNEIHREGRGLNAESSMDFFVEYPFVNNVSGNYDRDGDGIFDASYIFRLTGLHSLNRSDQIGLRGTLTLSGLQGNVDIDYYPTDTVEDLLKRINLSGSEVVARLDYQGKLTLKGVPALQPENPDFVIRHVEDSGQFLVGYAGILSDSGSESAFDWEVADAVNVLRTEEVNYAVAPLTHPAAWIDVNPALEEDAGRIASSFAPGDGAAALAIAHLRTEPVMVGVITNFDNFFAELVAEIGLKGEQASSALQTEELIMKELSDLRESISGVNMDEEITNMIKYQHSYAAAARFVSEVDKMLDIIINRIGV